MNKETFLQKLSETSPQGSDDLPMLRDALRFASEENIESQRDAVYRMLQACFQQQRSKEEELDQRYSRSINFMLFGTR